jgi:hypothetical protein
LLKEAGVVVEQFAESFVDLVKDVVAGHSRRFRFKV